MDPSLQTELICYSISMFSLLLIIIIFLSFPAIFLKHPNQVYLYFVFFQMLHQCTSILLEILSLEYPLFRKSLSNSLYNFIVYPDLLIDFLSLHYLLALNIEITFKLSSTPRQDYKKRVLIYHMACTTLSLSLFTVFLSVTDFNLNMDKNTRSNVTYNVVFWYINTLYLLSWMCIAVYFKQMVKSKASSLLSLVIVTLCFNISRTISVGLPQIMYYCEVSFSYAELESWIDLGCESGVGIVQLIIVLVSRKFLRLAKSILQQKRERFRKNRNRALVGRSVSSVLIEINNSTSILGDVGLLGDFFDHVTKIVWEI